MPYMHHLRRDLRDHTSKADRKHGKATPSQRQERERRHTSLLILLTLLGFILLTV